MRQGRISKESLLTPATARSAGKSADLAWDGFLAGELANVRTLNNCVHAVICFLRMGRRPRASLGQSIAMGYR